MVLSARERIAVVGLNEMSQHCPGHEENVSVKTNTPCETLETQRGTPRRERAHWWKHKCKEVGMSLVCSGNSSK